jgi:aminopeptidase N
MSLRTDSARPVRLADYRPPDHLVESVSLDIILNGADTRAISTMTVRPNASGVPGAPLTLNADSLTLVRIELDGTPLAETAFTVSPTELLLHHPPQRPFRVTVETRLDPAANTELMGLYRSNSSYCTQCEAEGFRRITYFPDRPDVLAVYTTRIEADRDEAPVLLANGNRVAAGDLPGGRHYAVWHDPFPKPSYLFAMVAGRLACLRDSFTTRSGREVALEIFVEPGKEDRCAYAMDALKRAMRWDEEVFGREYDLDVFMIVAVSDFNMGAMENKGLNIFNDKYVLALPDRATDQDYANIEAIIAHEYFHNWTGNRITCRDWFQLCLKEGLTVFRDQEFTADQRSRPVKRIADVRILRAQQFAEDAGPLAHPVRPEVYNEINNFYTATVYEKGAEAVRMLKTLAGEAAFRAGMDLYFDRHDGQAVTVEEFLACFSETSDRDLSRFMLWYRQAGTPEVHAQGHYDPSAGTYRLDLSQSLRPIPGQTARQPLVIPIRLGFVGEEGDMSSRLEGRPFGGLIVLDKARQSFVFEGMDSRPVPSLLRGFSAPVKLSIDLPEDDLIRLARRDSDPFNRWQAIQTLATQQILRQVADPTRPIDQRFPDALRSVALDEALDPAFAALALTVPSEADIAREIGRDVDPDAILTARRAVRAALATQLGADLLALHERTRATSPYSPDAAQAGRRALRNVALDLACAEGDHGALTRAEEQFHAADNMTDRIAALSTLCLAGSSARENALLAFHERYRDDPLVVDKWLGLQAQIPEPGTLDRVQRLLNHPSFSLANPNRVRALIGTFASANQSQFNRLDGAGYEFTVDIALEIDARNPQVAARLLSAFKSWQALEPCRRRAAETALRRAADTAGLSRDSTDIVGRALA